VKPKACWRKSSRFKSAIGRLENEDETRTDEQEREQLAKAPLVKKTVKSPSHPLLLLGRDEDAIRSLRTALDVNPNYVSAFAVGGTRGDREATKDREAVPSELRDEL
jgi:hypothetical protein